MRKSILSLAAVLAIGAASTAAHANNFLVQLDDSTGTLYGLTYEDGRLIQNVSIGADSYSGGYYLGWNLDAFLDSDVDVSVNIYDPNGTLSDTWHLFGGAGDGSLSIPFYSDLNDLPPTVLTGATRLVETGDWQTVAQTSLTNGDNFTWQFRSGLDGTVSPGVPEPAGWALMLVGLGGLGASLRMRRKAALA